MLRPTVMETKTASAIHRPAMLDGDHRQDAEDHDGVRRVTGREDVAAVEHGARMRGQRRPQPPGRELDAADGQIEHRERCDEQDERAPRSLPQRPIGEVDEGDVRRRAALADDHVMQQPAVLRPGSGAQRSDAAAT